MCNSTKTPSTLFDSIIFSERAEARKAYVISIMQRVGHVLRVADARHLEEIENVFTLKLTALIKDTCNAIDNELSKAQED